MTKHLYIFTSIVLIILIVWYAVSSFSLYSITPTYTNTKNCSKKNRVRWKDPLVSIITIPGKDFP